MAKVNEIRGLIYSKYDSESALAAELGWSRQKLNTITNGNREPGLDEIAALADKLECPIEEIVQIFLQHKSPNGLQSLKGARL